MSQALQFFWACLLLAGFSLAESRLLEEVILVSLNSNTSSYNAEAGYHGVFDPNPSGKLVLNLCECERAEGEPNGLSCGPKQGWFISNFEHQGTWLGGGGLVPLSHAICCRPCLPSTLPPQLSAYIAARDAQRSQGSSDPTDIPIPASASATDIIDTGFRKLTHAVHASEPNPHTLQQPTHGTSTQHADPLQHTTIQQDTTTDAGRGQATGAVSLSMASIIQEADNAPPITPVALVSIGCHGSSGRPGRFFQALMCEPMGASFVTGFSHSERVSAFYPDIYYPLSQVVCCTPGVLLPNGEVWPLVRCNCYQSVTKDCGGLDTHTLLWGFSSWRVTRTGDILPVAPLECCQLCLADIPTAAASCQDLGLCNGAGVCVQGACQCFEGFGGSDCSLQQQTGGDGFLDDVPWWGIVLIFSGTMMFIYSSMHVGRVVYDAVAGRDQSAGYNVQGNGQRGMGHGDMIPLLQSLLESHNGSVGSRDTDDEGEEGDHDVGDEEGAPTREQTQSRHGRARQRRGRRAVARFGGMLEEQGRRIGGDEGEGEGEDEQGEEEPGEEEQQEEEEEEQETEILGAWSPDVATLLTQQAARDAVREARERDDMGRGPLVVQAVDLGNPLPVPGAEDEPAAAAPVTAPGEIAAAAVAAAAAAAASLPAPAAAVTVPVDISELAPTPEQGVEDAAGVGPAEAALRSHSVVCESETSAVQQHADMQGNHIMCIACMEAPIQVALVPCGHANLCRKCSRRLEHCPICRKLITRRQRLYFGAG